MNTKKISIFFKKNLTTIAIVAFLVFLFCISFGSSLLETWKLYSYKQDLLSQIAVKEEESKQLDEDIKQIGSQEYIERIARQYLELYYPNEQIVIPVENEMSKDNTAQNQGSGQEQAKQSDQESTQQREQEQTAQDQDVSTTDSELIEDEDTDQQDLDQETEESEEQSQETVQEDQVTTDEE